jgi:hypothetical protein
MVLESYLRKKLDEKEILLMTHIVLGYPSLQLKTHRSHGGVRG